MKLHDNIGYAKKSLEVNQGFFEWCTKRYSVFYFSAVTVKYFLATVPLLSFILMHMLYVPALENFRVETELVLKSCLVVHEDAFISL